MKKLVKILRRKRFRGDREKPATARNISDKSQNKM